MQSRLLGVLGTATLAVSLSSPSIAQSAAAKRVNPEVASCKVITTPAQLKAINTNDVTRAGSYCLGKDIDMAGVAFTPIGDGSVLPGRAFSGQFYGNGHVIRNLTITGTTEGYYGLFGLVSGGTIRDVGLVNVTVGVTPPAATFTYAGALFGMAQASASEIFISNVYSTGKVSCTSGNCIAGGLFGITLNNVTMHDAWSSAEVTATVFAGGLAGEMTSGASTYQRLYATGNVFIPTSGGIAGGLVGDYSSSSNSPSYMDQVYATGRVSVGTGGSAGGLLGRLVNAASLRGAYATGPVSGSNFADVGGLIGTQSDGVINQVFAAGAVSSGGTSGGLIGSTTGSPIVVNAYWDTATTGMSMSASGGTGLTTAQLQAKLPAGFTLGWGSTKNLSYPYLGDPDNFSSTLATLVVSNKIFAFLPIQQLDKSQYIGNPVHTDQASLATVYTMIGRAIGVTDNVATLNGVKVNKYYWHDNTLQTTFSGPITAHATLGAMTSIAAATPLNATNVIGQMNAGRLVILRGTYKKAGGGTATHHMLGTLYVKSGNTLVSVVANDPWTGTQVEISPTTKKVTTPGFPLTNFTVDGYQPVMTLN